MSAHSLTQDPNQYSRKLCSGSAEPTDTAIEDGVHFQVLSSECCNTSVHLRLSPKTLITDPAPTAPLPAASKWVGLTAHGSDVLRWS